MTGPGSAARGLIARWCSATTMRRIVDPTIADLQAEYHEAAAQSGPWHARTAWISGHAALLRAVVIYASSETVGLMLRPSDDRRMFTRLVLTSTVLAIAGTAAFDAGTLTLLARFRHVATSAALAITLAVQTLPIALPVAIALAALWARARGGVSRWRTVVFCLSVGASIASLVIVGWIAPAVTRALSAPMASVSDAAPPMLTLGELRARVALDASAPSPYALVTALSYDLRWALAAAPVALGGFVIALTSGGRRRAWLAVLGSVAALAYLVVLVESLRLGVMNALPVFVAAWAPNVLFVAMAALTTAALRWTTPANFQSPRWT